MSVLPEPAVLDDPPGRPDSVQDAAADARAAAGFLAELARSVGTAHVPSWEGADARALSDRRSSVSRVSADAADALQRGAARLAEHADLWHGTRARLEALRTEQEVDRVAASRRLAIPFDPSNPLVTPVDDVLDALAAAEDRRAAEHRRLLAVLDDDAVDTSRVLRACCLAVGAVGGRGRTGREVAHLASLLPGWGASEKSARGHALAEVLGHGDPQQSEASAAELVGLAGDAVFASALLAELGEGGVGRLLALVNDAELGEGSAVARVLAAALGAAAALPVADRRVRAVLSARYVEASDWTRSEPDEVARGMAIVASTGVRYGAAPAPEMLAGWFRQVSARVSELGPIADRLGTLGDEAHADPLPGIVTALAATRDGRAAAGLLSDREMWTQLLRRSWPDGGDAVAAVVSSLSGAPDEAARTALRAGLEVLGSGLEDGHLDGWAVHRGTAEHLRGAFAEALGAHIDAITGPLADVAGRCPDPGELAALHGLGFVTIDEGATTALVRGMRAWAERPHPEALSSSGGSVVVAVPSAFLAVLDYGQRLAHSMRAHDAQAEADKARRRWEATAGLLFWIVGQRARGADSLVEAAETTLQRAAGADGRFEIGKDRGRRFTVADAAAAVTGGAGGHRDDGLRLVAVTGAEAFAQVRRVLGEPVVAVPDDRTLTEELLEDALEMDPKGPRASGSTARRGGAGAVPD